MMKIILIPLIIILMLSVGACGEEDFSNSSECVGDVWAGDFVLTDQDDVAEIAKYVAVTGNFYVKDSEFVNVHLLKLCEIGGDVVFDNSKFLADFSAPKLLSIGGNIALNGNVPSTVNLSKVSNIGGNISFSNMYSNVVVDLASLVFVGGEINISGSEVSGPLSFTKLKEVGGNLYITLM